MSKQSFTPGPWLCCDGPEHYEHRIYVDATETTGTAICDVVSTNDARLIAAAPDLLDIAQRARNLVMEICEEASFPTPQTFIDAADVAIAKARGDA